MTARQGYRVAATTTGIASSPFEHLRKNYVYGGDQRDDEPFSASMAESSAERKRRRLARLAELEAVRPPLPLAEIARRLQLSPKTVRGYQAERRARETGGAS